MDNFTKLAFFRNLALITSSDISLYDGLESLKSRNKNKDMLEFYEHMQDGFLNSKTISSSLFESNFEFKKNTIKVLEIGEHTGSISKVLDDLSDSLESEIELKAKIKSSASYPVFLFFVVFLVLSVMLVKLVPMFNEILESFGLELSSFSKFLMSASKFLERYGIAMFLCVSGILLALYLYFTKTKNGKARLDNILYKSIFTRSIKKDLFASEFSRNMHLLVKSGISFSESLEFISETIENKNRKESILKAKKMIEEGSSLEEAIKSLDIFPDILLEIIEIAAKTGKLETALLRSNKILKKKLEEKISFLSSIIEPILILIISIVIGAILLATVFPIFDVLNNIT